MNTNTNRSELEPNYKRLRKESEKIQRLNWIEFKELEIPKLKEISLK